jgi:hypothetical protein
MKNIHYKLTFLIVTIGYNAFLKQYLGKKVKITYYI